MTGKQLLDRLKETGTGVDKLRRIAELAGHTLEPQALANAAGQLGFDGTLDKLVALCAEGRVAVVRPVMAAAATADQALAQEALELRAKVRAMETDLADARNGLTALSATRDKLTDRVAELEKQLAATAAAKK